MLLDRLRQESRPHHVRLEEAVGLAASIEQHQLITRGFFGFIEPWEKAVLASPHASFLEGRTKTSLLVDDLRHFGMSAAAISALPRCLDIPPVASLPAMLGALYVIEGSTLGGQMISRHLETSFGLSDGNGYRYFLSYGSDTPRKWQEFRRVLLEHSSPENDDLIVAAAKDTFDALHRWFCPAPAQA